MRIKLDDMETLGKNPRLVNGSSEQGIGALERF